MFKGLKNLEEIQLNKNEIKFIPADLFEYRINLTKINLCCNKLWYIDETTFKGLVNLKEIWLHNQISNFDN